MSEEERKRRQMGSPVWPLKPGPFEWEKGQITMSEQMKAKMAAAEFEKEIVKRAYDTARDHASDDRSVMELADDIQYLMMLAFRKGQRS